jgi:hypothetical protein
MMVTDLDDKFSRESARAIRRWDRIGWFTSGVLFVILFGIFVSVVSAKPDLGL